MNNKGKGGAIVGGFFVIALVMVGLVGYGVFQLSEQTAATTEPATVQENLAQTSQALKSGTASSHKFKAQDKASASNAQVATSLSVEEWDGGAYGQGKMVLIADATALSASTTTTVTTTIGKWLKACAFNQSTYYGDCLTFQVTSEGDTTTLSSYAIAQSLQVEGFDANVLEPQTTSEVIANLTLGASAEASLDYLQIVQNTSDKVFRLRGIGFNVSDASNLDDISIAGALNWGETNSKAQGAPGALASAAEPKRLKVLDFYFQLPSYVQMWENDVLKTPAIKFTSGGTNPSELVTVYLIDEGEFKSVLQPDRILSGVENDEEVEEDVGAPDYRRTISIE